MAKNGLKTHFSGLINSAPKQAHASNYFRNVFEDFSSFEAENHVRRHQQPSRRLPHVVVVGFVVIGVVVVDVVPGNGIEIEVRGKWWP